jgi:flagellar protein FlgJ
MTREAFVGRMQEAIRVAKAKGARVNALAVTAQAALESGWGASGLATAANNLFGIKAGPTWRGEVLELPTWEHAPQTGWYRTVARWRAYPSWNECIVDYARIIASLSWFADALPHADPPDGDGDAEAWIRALLPAPGQPGWATDPDYLAKVRSVGLQVAAVAPGWGWPRPA